MIKASEPTPTLLPPTSTPPPPTPPPPPVEPTLPQLGRFVAYRKALRCVALVHALGLRGELRDQMERAAYSVVLNLAEGSGQRDGASKRRFYVIARSSLLEVAAAVDLVALMRPESVELEALRSAVREESAILRALVS